MCGIVAYTGNTPASPIILNCLARLEYRGYDSAGIAVQEPGGLKVCKEKGKISALNQIVEPLQLAGTCGIGHTRWATHGAPSRENAHPHLSRNGQIAVVHNGIVENYRALKEELGKEGYAFVSETDSEVIAHLLEKYYTGNLEEAMRQAVGKMIGTFGLAAACSGEPGKIVGIRRGSPLVLGIGKAGGHFLVSDPAALAGLAEEVIYLEENQLAILQPQRYSVQDLRGGINLPAKTRLELDAALVQKGGYPHFMLKEICEQPQTIRDTLRGRLLLGEGNAKLSGLNLVRDHLRKINRIIFVACGTSWHAALCGEYLLEEVAGIPVEVEYASEFRYRNPIIEHDTLVFCISQSGETADTLAALQEASNRGAMTLGICNVVGSSIARQTQGGIYLHAGPEIGVASTKAFTSQVAVLSLLTLLLGRMRRISSEQGIEIAQAIDRLPEQVQQILDIKEEIKQTILPYQNARNFLFLGRSFNFPVALEGALKLKEISYIHAEGYPAAEMKHGPIALIDQDMPTVFIAPQDHIYEKVLSNIQEVKARGGKIIAICTNAAELKGVADHIIQIPKTLDFLMPILTVIPLQLMAYYIAVARGCNVDQPRNLAKSVTVE